MSFLFALLLFSAAVPASADGGVKAPPPSIGVSPSRMEVELKPGTTTGSATVLNLSDRDINVSSSLVGFDLDENNDFRELAPEPGTLPTAMIVNPVKFTIPAGGSQTVRFAIQTDRLKGEGEHRAMLFFSELVDTSLAGVKLNFRLGMPIYALAGEPNPIAAFNDLRYDRERSQIELDISSFGNAQVRPTGYYLWWPLADFPEQSRAFGEVARMVKNPSREKPSGLTGGRLVAKPIFPGTRRTVAAGLMPPPDGGEYMLVLQVDAGGQTLQQAIEHTAANLLIVDSD
jgi:P pilus assembly chaperone PapD